MAMVFLRDFYRFFDWWLKFRVSLLIILVFFVLVCLRLQLFVVFWCLFLDVNVKIEEGISATKKKVIN